MKFDLNLILRNFAVHDGVLYRKYKNGAVPVTLTYRGRLMSEIANTRYFGPDVAYACIYGVVPMFPIVQVDGNPHNVAEDNLMPVRLKRLRYRETAVPGGFRHPLTTLTHTTQARCHADWVLRAKRYYQDDKMYVRQLEDQYKPARPAVFNEPEPTVLQPVRRKIVRTSTRPAKPSRVFGRVWHWYKDDWLSLPEPVHQSDDWMVRAAVVSEHPNARFVYDELKQMTVPVL